MSPREAVLTEGRLGAPTVGIWRPSIGEGDRLFPGRVIGTLTQLGQRITVLTPAPGIARDLRPAGPVGYDDVLLTLGEALRDDAVLADAQASADGWAIRAPIDGIFYRRPSPDAPAFAELGAAVTAGQTLGLIEVMKTFNPVRLDGPGAPSTGVVASVEVGDHAEVTAGQVLLRVRPG